MTIQKRTFVGTFAFVVLSAAVGRSAPLGDQFRVNASPSGDQYAGAVAASANGDSVVVWQESSGCFAQRYDAAGRALYRGGLRVTQSAVMSQTSVVVALDRLGNLVVVEEAGDGSGLGIFATIYDRAGAVIVPRFRVNVTTAGTQAGPQVAVNGQREIVISWGSQGPQNPDGSSTFFPVVRRFHGNGSPVTPEIFLNGPTYSMAGVAIGESGNFVVTYTVEKLGVGSYGEVFMRRFDASGGALGSATQVNTTTPGLQRQSRIALERSSEQFVIVWESYDSTDGWRVRGQRFAQNGSPLAGEFRVDPEAPASESQPEVAMADDGSFVVTWGISKSVAGVPAFQVLGRSYSYAGIALGNPFIVRSGSSAAFGGQEMSMDPAGNFVSVWSGRDTGDWDAYGRRFARDDAAITPIANGQSIAGIAASTFYWAPQGTLGEFKYYKVNVPSGTTRLNVSISGGASGDADLYLRYGLLPSVSAWDARPYVDGSNESITTTQPASGDWYIGVHAYETFSGATLTVSYN